MSGGFFRGTSADQDTRFSNKQAKLLKSQKFAPGLEHLVDMTKVKIDVIKPWIATRATELLGFEDEVLINFIYGLLDGKGVDGKQIQIQLTGFMEKNTGKFMKELWVLLLSAQNNASGIPQQFLDAKEEETRKKKEEADRITHEIQRKKENEGKHNEYARKMDGNAGVSRAANIAGGDLKKSLTARSEEERGLDERNGSERRIRNSPSHVRSSSKSLSRSQSYSDERQKSRSISRSPPRQRGSVSQGRHYRSPRKHSVSPHGRQSPQVPRSPATRRLSPHSRRKSPSPWRRRSPSPKRRRSPSPRRRRFPSPRRRRSPSPRRHQLPSPRRHQSPSPRHRQPPSSRRHRSPSLRRLRSPSPRQLRSPSPKRRRSPLLSRRRSPSPLRRISHSPLQRRSPHIRRRSPLSARHRSPSPRWRSPLPSRWHSPSSLRRRSPPPRSPRQWRRSPVRSSPRRAVDSQSPPRQNYSPRRSPIPHRNRRSMSRDHDGQANGMGFRKSQDEFASRRSQRKRSPVSPAPNSSLEREEAERSGSVPKGQDSRQAQISLRSPQRDLRELRGPAYKGLRPERSPRFSHSPPSQQKKSPVVDRSSSESPSKQPGKRAVHYDSPKSSKEEAVIHHAREDSGCGPVHLRKKASYSPFGFAMKRSLVDSDNDEDSLCREPAGQSEDHRQRSDETSPRKVSPERRCLQTSHLSKEIEYKPGRTRKESLDQVPDEKLLAKHSGRHSYSLDEKLDAKQVNLKKSSSREDYRVNEKRSSTANDEYGDHDQKTYEMQKSVKKMGQNDGVDFYDSDSNKREISRSHKMEKRKHKMTENHVDDDDYDSQLDERKEAKRRRKEEKRLRKEEKRRRREERRRKKDERRAGKLKPKHVDTVTPPSDVENNQNLSGDTDGDVDPRRVTQTSDLEGTELEQKKLEFELRNKALESLRAKKAISQ